MRITYIGGTLLLLSALARSGRTVASSMPALVLRPNFNEHAHFQCLINLCSPESYGRALEYSVSACCDSGVNLIPLHPIEIRQPLQHRRSQQPAAPEKKHIVDASTAFDQGFDLARNFAVALTCNTGQDGVVTVSLGSPVPSMSSASLAVNEDLFSVNGFITTILSNEPAATSWNLKSEFGTRHGSKSRWHHNHVLHRQQSRIKLVIPDLRSYSMLCIFQKRDIDTSSNTFTTASTFDGTFAATPAAYTFASPSLPPAYIPPLADYGYGTPPPAYGFSSQGIGGGENRPSGNSYTTSSVAQQSSFGAGRQDVSPAAYSTSRETPARMAHAAPAHATNTGLDETKPQIGSPAVEVTIVSSVSGEGLQTTVMTINQVEATSFAIPSVLALDSPVSNRQNSTGVEKGSVSSNEKPASNDEFDNTGGNGFETPMPAMLVGGSMTIDPSIYVLISTLCLAVGFSICIL
ncbi:hypothetical protein ED733_002305 [Metarhizium rileyi]|uniref:Uncharacterized protein n=1 Tax=Metarhizium rileyi (strain RCEF 4871) TaxID=1649241 RepID=A0A5C6GC86_METRR|nr:hypothetical protein ED733_002305 [Metarhizium rileyi]